MTKVKIKPNTYKSGVFIFSWPCQSVARAEKIWIPLGMLITILAMVNTLRLSTGSPVANM